MGAVGPAASADGRPFAWKNRDSDDGNNGLGYVAASTGATWSYVTVGRGSTYLGMNEAGVAFGNSVADNLSGGNSSSLISWILANTATVRAMEQAVRDEAATGAAHIDYGDLSAQGCFPVIGQDGTAELFEVGSDGDTVGALYEYDTAARATGIVVRANDAHQNTDGSDDATTGGNRFYEANSNLLAAAASGGVTVREMIDVARFGAPGFDEPSRNSRYQTNGLDTRCTLIAHGVRGGEDPRTATMWVSPGQPDYCCFVPVWAAAGNSLSSYLTSTADAGGISGRGWAIFAMRTGPAYDRYVNSFYSGLETNFIAAAALAREHWLARGFTAQQADAISDEAAAAAWSTMNSMCAGPSNDLNRTPVLTEVLCRTNGLDAALSCIAHDPDGALVSTNWDFGDGNTADGAAPTHRYATNGLYLVRCRVADNEGSRNVRWRLVGVQRAAGPPQARLRASPPGELALNEPLVLDAAASTDGGWIEAYGWDFGDGDTGTGPAPVHTYRQAGTHTVTLTVTDNEGLTASASTSVWVRGDSYLVDNDRPGCTLIGPWPRSADATVYGTPSRTCSSAYAAKAIYEFTPATGGLFTVYLRWTADASRDASVPVTIEQAGRSTTSYVDQRTGGGAWNRLGECSLSAGAPVSLTVLHEKGGGSVSADAVKIVRTGAPWITNAPAVCVTTTGATLRAELVSTGLWPTAVSVFWGRQAGGASTGSWEHGAFLGWHAGPAPAAYRCPVGGLEAGQTYYYSFVASNQAGAAWAPAVESFQTPRVLRDWAFGAKVDLAGYAGATTLTNFPVLVRLANTPGGFRYDQSATASGADLCFTDATRTQRLDHEVEEWNTNGTSTVWVRVPRLASPSDHIWMLWGSPHLEAPAASTVWTSSFAGVWHLAAPLADSTPNHNDGINSGATVAGGLIGPAGRFAGGQYVDVGTAGASAHQGTVSAWARFTGAGASSEYVFGHRTGSDNNRIYLRRNNGLFSPGMGDKLGSALYESGAIGTNWTHLAMTWDRGACRVYRNGQPVGSGTYADFASLGAVASIGSLVTTHTFLWSGDIDEVRLSSTPRSADWLRACWSNQCANSQFARLGPALRTDLDTDGDGMGDVWEQHHFGSLSAPDGAAAADWDGDGACNGDEFAAGTDPSDAAACLRLDALRACNADGRWIVAWQSVSNRFYAIDLTTNLAQGFPVTVSNGIAGTPPANTVTVRVDAAASAFLRIRIED